VAFFNLGDNISSLRVATKQPRSEGSRPSESRLRFGQRAEQSTAGCFYSRCSPAISRYLRMFRPVLDYLTTHPLIAAAAILCP